MIELSKPIEIYAGEVVVKYEDIELNPNLVKVSYQWFPKLHVLVDANESVRFKDLWRKKFSTYPVVEVYVQGVKFGQGQIWELAYSDSSDGVSSYNIKIKIDESSLGDINIKVSEIQFGLVNLKRLNTKLTNNNIVLKDEKYTIDISYAMEDIFNGFRDLGMKGGYLKTYNCKLIRNDNKSISFKEIGKVLRKIESLFSFINGRTVCPIFQKGYHDSILIWETFYSKNILPYHWSKNWYYSKEVDLNSLWNSMSTLCDNIEDESALLSSIEWYVESNNSMANWKVRIIMAQAALELLYNWLIVDKKKLILGKDKENISASNKIRILLNFVNGVENFDFNEYKTLKEYVKNSGDCEDAFDVIVQIRNAIVHSQKKKRDSLDKFDYSLILEAIDLCMLCIEICILKSLKYTGKFQNRSKKISEFDWAVDVLN